MGGLQKLPDVLLRIASCRTDLGLVGAERLRPALSTLGLLRCLLESLLCLRRAGADIIFTYGALDAARLLAAQK